MQKSTNILQSDRSAIIFLPNINIPSVNRSQRTCDGCVKLPRISLSAPTTCRAGHIAVMGVHRAVESEPTTRRSAYRRIMPTIRTHSPTDNNPLQNPTLILRERLHRKGLCDAMEKKFAKMKEGDSVSVSSSSTEGELF